MCWICHAREATNVIKRMNEARAKSKDKAELMPPSGARDVLIELDFDGENKVVGYFNTLSQEWRIKNGNGPHGYEALQHTVKSWQELPERAELKVEHKKKVETGVEFLRHEDLTLEWYDARKSAPIHALTMYNVELEDGSMDKANYQVLRGLIGQPNLWGTDQKVLRWRKI